MGGTRLMRQGSRKLLKHLESTISASSRLAVAALGPRESYAITLPKQCRKILLAKGTVPVLVLCALLHTYECSAGWVHRGPERPLRKPRRSWRCFASRWNFRPRRASPEE